MRYETDYVDYGCGFPVVIDRVIVAKRGTDQIPLINHKLLEDKVVDWFTRPAH